MLMMHWSEKFWNSEGIRYIGSFFSQVTERRKTYVSYGKTTGKASV